MPGPHQYGSKSTNPNQDERTGNRRCGGTGIGDTKIGDRNGGMVTGDAGGGCDGPACGRPTGADLCGPEPIDPPRVWAMTCTGRLCIAKAARMPATQRFISATLAPLRPNRKGATVTAVAAGECDS